MRIEINRPGHPPLRPVFRASTEAAQPRDTFVAVSAANSPKVLTPDCVTATLCKQARFPELDSQGFRTVMITPKKREEFHDRDALQALEALALERPDEVKIVRDPDSGSSRFRSQHLFKVHHSFTSQFQALIEQGGSLEITDLAELVNTRPGRNPSVKQASSELGSDNLAIQTKGMLSTLNLLRGGSTSLDRPTREQMATRTFNLSTRLMQLHNEVRSDDKDAPINDGLRWMRQQSAELLHRLDTPRSLTLGLRLLELGDESVLEQTASSSTTAASSVEHTLGLIRARSRQTVDYLNAPPESRSEMRTAVASGGHLFLPGSYELQSAYQLTADDPFAEIPSGAMLLLGTRHSDMARQKLESFILEADNDLPMLQAAQKRFAAEEEPLTGQKDVHGLVSSLGRITSEHDKLFSQELADTQVANLVVKVLPRLNTAAMHRRMTDLGLELLSTSTDLDCEQKHRLVDALITPGADPEAHQLAAVALVGKGELSALPPSVEALSNPNPEVRSFSAGALQAVAAALQGRPVGNAQEMVEKLADPQTRLQVQARLLSAVPKFAALLFDQDSVWLRILAARALADLQPATPEAVKAMRDLLHDDGERLSFGPANVMGKNVHVRRQAAQALQLFGPHAVSALPELRHYAKLGLEAGQVLKQIDAMRQKHSGVEPYYAQDDPAARALMIPVLKAAAQAGNRAEAALRMLQDPDSPKQSEIERFYHSNFPWAQTILEETAQVGEASGQAVAAILSSQSE